MTLATVMDFGPVKRPIMVKPLPVDTDDYERACVAFLYACFRELPKTEIKARAERMREAKMRLEGR